MTKSFATCCAVVALLIGCGTGDERAVFTHTDSDELELIADDAPADFECRPDDVLPSYPAFSPGAAARVEFRCLQFAHADELQAETRSYHFIDIDPGSAASGGSTGALQIALHEIKTKAFLKGKKVAVISDGKRFGAIERECKAIQASGVEELVAVVQGSQRTESLQRISAREFIGERPYGVWRVVNQSSNAELDSPLLIDTAGIEQVLAQKRRSDSKTPIRTLIVADGGTETSSDQFVSSRHSGYVFVLEGGLQGLREFEAKATALARAKARPRIGERGCQS